MKRASFALALAACGHGGAAVRPPIGHTPGPVVVRPPCVLEQTHPGSPTVSRVTTRFDDAGRVIATERDLDGDGTIEQTIRSTYDAAGHLLLTDEGDRTIRNELDGDGRVIAVVTTESDQVQFRAEKSYDAAGHLVAERNSSSHQLYEYDAAGHLTRLQAFELRDSTPSMDLRYRYDAAGRRVSADTLVGGMLIQQRWTYDAAGHQIEAVSTSDAGSTVIVHTTFDGAGRRTEEVASGSVEGRRTWTYDPNRDLVTEEDTSDDGSVTRSRYVDCAGSPAAADHELTEPDP